jgi:hypothetical protein
MHQISGLECDVGVACCLRRRSWTATVIDFVMLYARVLVRSSDSWPLPWLGSMVAALYLFLSAGKWMLFECFLRLLSVDWGWKVAFLHEDVTHVGVLAQCIGSIVIELYLSSGSLEFRKMCDLPSW